MLIAGHRRIRPAPALAGAAAALLAAAVIAVSLGAVRLSLGEVAGGLLDAGDDTTRRIVWQLRVPRVLAAALVGAHLGLAGALLQGVTRNPLADPHILGFSSGAGFVAVALVVWAPGSPGALAPAGAFAGSLLSAAVVYALAWRGGISPVRFALSGVAVAALFTALSAAAISLSDLFTQAALSFLVGGLIGVGWDHLPRIAPYTAAGALAAVGLARSLNVLSLGDDVARGLGMRVERVRLAAVAAAAALTGAAVAVSGILAFVGLVAPHAARLLVGGDYRLVLPLSGLLGAALLVLADTAARTAWAPTEIPAGIVTAIVGAPVLLLLIRTRT